MLRASCEVAIDECISNFSNGVAYDAFKFMGAHIFDNKCIFRVWAPNAAAAFVVGDFTGWNEHPYRMSKLNGGIWEAEITGVNQFDHYKYMLKRPDGTVVLKSDPYAFHCATRPNNASRVYDIGGYEWHDEEYKNHRDGTDPIASPINIYEVHLGSWKVHDDGNPYSYVDLAEQLPRYAAEMGYTHIELLPVAEHPFDPSWGYQITGFYAPTSRFGTPKDFMYFVDCCHAHGIGVILDWVGAHFPKDENGLFEFDGTCLYESDDPLMNEHPDWNTRIFDYDRNEVRSFLISNVCYWLEMYHIDGIRADAVASMLYLDYGRRGGKWRANSNGGNINESAVRLLRDINKAAFTINPKVLMIAEESTAFPLVTKPDYIGGLGFNFKWNMGWMHDMLDYMSADPLYRRGKHNSLTFALTYAFSENFILPFSHDEVVHGKRSMINKMPGDYYGKFANLRALYAYMFAHPGKKLTFMGNEFAQFIEWNFAKQLDWFLLEYDSHRKMSDFIRELNLFYRENPPLWENDADWEGFSWIAADDTEKSIVSYYRTDRRGEHIVAVCNFCPILRNNYRIGIPGDGMLKAVFCSDYKKYGGFTEQLLPVEIENVAMHSFEHSASLVIPPMSVTYYKICKSNSTGSMKEPDGSSCTRKE